MKHIHFLSILCSFLFVSIGFSQQSNSRYTETGFAVFYADYLHGQTTAMGETYDRNQLTCAHKDHPMGTLLKVTHLGNGRSVTVRVNDRGPYGDGLAIDLSKAAAFQLNLINEGKARVNIEVVGFSNYNPTLTTPIPSDYGEFNAKFPAVREGLTARGGTTTTAVPANTPTGYDISAAAIKKLPSDQKGYVIQVGSYSNTANANRQYLALTQQGVADLYQMQGRDKSGRTITKLVVAVFQDRANAQSYLNTVIKAKHKMGGFIAKL